MNCTRAMPSYLLNDCLLLYIAKMMESFFAMLPRFFYKDAFCLCSGLVCGSSICGYFFITEMLT